MLKGKIEFAGRTRLDVEICIEAALRRIRGGNDTGFDRYRAADGDTEDCRFNFVVTGREDGTYTEG